MKPVNLILRLGTAASSLLLSAACIAYCAGCLDLRMLEAPQTGESVLPTEQPAAKAAEKPSTAQQKDPVFMPSSKSILLSSQFDYSLPPAGNKAPAASESKTPENPAPAAGEKKEPMFMPGTKSFLPHNFVTGLTPAGPQPPWAPAKTGSPADIPTAYPPVPPQKSSNPPQ